MSINFTALLKNIAQDRQIFHSEADFQHALAWEIHRTNPLAKIRLEYPVRYKESTMYVDIFTVLDDRHIAIELKYKTRLATVKLLDEYYQLKSHGAQDIGCYDFVKDISRLETLRLNGKIDEGFAVMLTNDEAYRDNFGREGTNALAFRIYQGRDICGDLSWSEQTGIGTKKSREANLKIRSSYRLDWQLFSTIPEAKQSFHFLVVHVSA